MSWTLTEELAQEIKNYTTMIILAVIIAFSYGAFCSWKEKWTWPPAVAIREACRVPPSMDFRFPGK